MVRKSHGGECGLLPTCHSRYKAASPKVAPCLIGSKGSMHTVLVVRPSMAIIIKIRYSKGNMHVPVECQA